MAERASAGSGPPAEPLDPVLRERVEELIAQAPPRRLLGLAGAPGAGKSTLSAQIQAAFADRCVIVAMDGFHLAQAELERLGRADRKGAPDTFDAAGYVALLRRLRDPRGETVYAPEYRRDLHHGVTGAVPVPPEVPLVVTEGNYLLLDRDGFAPVRGLLDACWFVELPEEVRAERLVRRHQLFGKDAAAARAWASGPDQRNAELVAATRGRADLVVRPAVARSAVMRPGGAPLGPSGPLDRSGPSGGPGAGEVTAPPTPGATAVPGHGGRLVP